MTYFCNFSLIYYQFQLWIYIWFMFPWLTLVLLFYVIYYVHYKLLRTYRALQTESMYKQLLFSNGTWSVNFRSSSSSYCPRGYTLWYNGLFWVLRQFLLLEAKAYVTINVHKLFKDLSNGEIIQIWLEICLLPYWCIMYMYVKALLHSQTVYISLMLYGCMYYFKDFLWWFTA